MSATFVPSKYQQDVFDWIRQGSGDAVINAVAGSGKSTTIKKGAKLIPATSQALMVAFNTHTADHLRKTWDGADNIDFKTCHGLGYSAIAFSLPKGVRVNVQQYKYADIAKTIFQENKEANDFAHLMEKVRLALVDASDVEAVWSTVYHYGLEDSVTGDMISRLPMALKAGITLSKQGVIDFADMLWIPHVLDLSPRKFDWVFVDECQDLSKAQLELVLKARKNGGRMMFVGDPFQSIYGFAGADCESFDNIVHSLNATELPLSTCYRCPTKVIDLAKQIVPHIEAVEGAPEGIVGYLDQAELADKTQSGDLILCRLTAPLIKECIKMIRNRKAATVRGRDIGKSLTAIVKKVVRLHGRFDPDALVIWSATEQEKIQRKPHHESALEGHNDKVAGILACYEAFGAESTQAFIAEIEALFSDKLTAVVLSTVHRAKGLENERVFILKPEKLPLTWKGQKDWEAKQEMNLKYVALTRAMCEIHFVQSEV
jgi:superfamily I DNA/RNA helicase